ncbi:hypothetical protein ACXR2T_10790 [Leucobacter sp. HY1910]
MAGSRGARRIDWVTVRIWRSLCAATGLSTLACYLYPPQGMWLAAAVAPGLLVTLLLLVAGYADWERRCGRG